MENQVKGKKYDGYTPWLRKYCCNNYQYHCYGPQYNPSHKKEVINIKKATAMPRYRLLS